MGFGIIMNEGKCPSEMFSVRLPLIVSGVFVKILSISVLVLVLIFVGSDMEGRR